MGGSDQWGNITTGSELIRRKTGGEGFALTCPLITKANGEKFGKTEQGNVWLDPRYTTPYTFYQFWLNVSDEDSEKYVKIFTFLSKEEIEEALSQHRQTPHERILQKLLAQEVTQMVHGNEEYEKAAGASQILFGQGTSDMLRQWDEATFLSVFEGVPQFDIQSADLPADLMELLAVQTNIFPSKGECRKMILGGGLSLNKDKVTTIDLQVDNSMLLQGKYLLVQKGKKNYYIIRLIT